MENRIDQVVEPNDLTQILYAITNVKSFLPFLLKLSDDDRKSLQMLDDGRKPFTEKAYNFATRNVAINPGVELVEAGKRDLNLY